MIPEPSSTVSITNTENFIADLFRNRQTLRQWAEVTGQSQNMKIGRCAQMLASLVVGVRGTHTAGRGDDLCDGSEVKECYRIDQTDTCRDCGKRVPRYAWACECGCFEKKYNNDSKWLISVPSEAKLANILSRPRFVFVLFDYLDFNLRNWDDAVISVFEIWPGHERCFRFGKILQDYYENDYLPNFNSGKRSPAPFNFWPDSHKFHLCNPVEVFRCEVLGIDTVNPAINIVKHIDPLVDRRQLPSHPTPISILNKEEIELITEHLEISEFVTEEMKEFLSIRRRSK